MKKSTKAALFSALVFPGTGQWVLRMWWRGFLFIIPTLLASGYLMNYGVDRALDAADRIMSGEVGLDPVAIEQLLDEKPPPGTALLVDTAKYLLIGCWIGSIVDAAIQGKKRDRELVSARALSGEVPH